MEGEGGSSRRKRSSPGTSSTESGPWAPLPEDVSHLSPRDIELFLIINCGLFNSGNVHGGV